MKQKEYKIDDKISVMLHYFIIVFILVTIVYATVPFDTGFKQWTQPNQVTFNARYWGDGFRWWMRTSDDYAIIVGSNDYYYYALLDSTGEYTPSTNKVGIDSALAGSYQLERSAARETEIDDEIADFNTKVRENGETYAIKRASRTPPIIDKLGVILVDFTPSERYKEGSCDPIKGCPKSVYDKLFFSIDSSWYGAKDSTIHPDGDALYGSFREFYRQQSLLKLDVAGVGPNITFH